MVISVPPVLSRMALRTYKLLTHSFSSPWRTQSLRAVEQPSWQQISLGGGSLECKSSFSSCLFIPRSSLVPWLGAAYPCGNPEPRKAKVTGPCDGHLPELSTNPSRPQVGRLVMFLFGDNNSSLYHISSILKYDTRPSGLSWQGLYR